MAGYHSKDIPKGKFGEASKIKEECLEFEDAIEQGNKVMALVELSDLLGAIEGYLKSEYDNKITLQDLKIMSDVTRRVFETGHRHAKND